MGRAYDPARAMRERLKVLEVRERNRAEGQAVAEGVEETVALARSRGAAFEKATPRRGERETPYRRQGGLDWLAHKGRITASAVQKVAGERYGACWRRAGSAPTMGSTLEVQPSGGLPGRSVGVGPAVEAGGGPPAGGSRAGAASRAAVRAVGSGDGLRSRLRPGADPARGRRRRSRGGAHRGGAEGGAGYPEPAEPALMFRICS